MLWPLKALKSRSLGVPPVLDAILGPVRWDGMGWDRMRCTAGVLRMGRNGFLRQDSCMQHRKGFIPRAAYG